MEGLHIISNGGSGALVVGQNPISRKDVICLGFNEKDKVINFYNMLGDFIRENYKENTQ